MIGSIKSILIIDSLESAADLRSVALPSPPFLFLKTLSSGRLLHSIAADSIDRPRAGAPWYITVGRWVCTMSQSSIYILKEVASWNLNNNLFAAVFVQVRSDGSSYLALSVGLRVDGSSAGCELWEQDHLLLCSLRCCCLCTSFSYSSLPPHIFPRTSAFRLASPRETAASILLAADPRPVYIRDFGHKVCVLASC